MSLHINRGGGHEPDWQQHGEEPAEAAPPAARNAHLPAWSQADAHQDKRHGSDPSPPGSGKGPWGDDTGSGSAGRSKESSPLLPRSARERPPERPCFVLFFRAVSLLTICSALVLLAAQTTTLVNFFMHGRKLSILHVPQCVVRIYAVLLCFVVILVELEWPRAVANSFLATNWLFRGILYAFLGVLGLEELDEWNAPMGVSSDFITIAGLLQVGVGIWYVLMGITCMKGCRDRAHARHTKARAEFEVREAYRKEMALNA